MMDLTLTPLYLVRMRMNANFSNFQEGAMITLLAR